MTRKEEVPAVCCPHNRDQCPPCQKKQHNHTAVARHRAWSRALDDLLGVDDYPDVDALYPRVTLRGEVA